MDGKRHAAPSTHLRELFLDIYTKAESSEQVFYVVLVRILVCFEIRCVCAHHDFALDVNGFSRIAISVRRSSTF